MSNNIIEKLTERLNSAYSVVKKLSDEVEVDIKKMSSMKDKDEQMSFIVKFEMLKSNLSGFLLLIDILEKDCDQILSEISPEIDEFRNKLIEAVEKFKSPENMEKLKNNSNNTNSNNQTQNPNLN